MAAAKEFNIGKDTLVDFLVGKGFSKDDLKPTSKLTEDMYRSLQQEFQGDKVAKIKSDQIDLPKGSLEGKKKKDEEPPLFRKEAPAVVKKQAKEEVPPSVEAPPVVVAIAPPVEEKVEEPEVVKIEAPELEGPKVINKIDLSAIDSSTRPRKVTKKNEEKEPEATADRSVSDNFIGPEEPAVFEPQQPEEVKPQPEAKQPEPPAKAPEKVKTEDVKEVKEESVEVVETAPPAEEKIEPVVAELPPHVEEPADAEEPDVPPVIENIKAEKLEGPKILGKIELPVSNDTRPKQPAEEKRKRKRIPIEKKDNNNQSSMQLFPSYAS